MIVTKIEPVTKVKFKVYVEEQFAFVLYKGELSRFHLQEGGSLSEELYTKIKTEIVLKRAKMRAMHLLNDMDRTEGQLRQKLRQNGYPEDIVGQALDYVKSFGYINDENYIRRFVESRMDKKSRKEIYALLCQKGLKGSDVDSIMEEAYAGHTEEDAIRDIIRKKRWNLEAADEKEKQKIYAFLMRKGFRYEDIRQVIQVSVGNA